MYVEAALPTTVLVCPLEPAAQNPADVMSAPSMMSSPPPKSISKVQLPVNADITSAPAFRTNVPAGISSIWKTSPSAIVLPAAIRASMSKYSWIVRTMCVPAFAGKAAIESAPTPVVDFAVKSKVAMLVPSLTLRYIWQSR